MKYLLHMTGPELRYPIRDSNYSTIKLHWIDFNSPLNKKMLFIDVNGANAGLFNNTTYTFSMPITEGNRIIYSNVIPVPIQLNNSRTLVVRAFSEDLIPDPAFITSLYIEIELD